MTEKVGDAYDKEKINKLMKIIEFKEYKKKIFELIKSKETQPLPDKKPLKSILKNGNANRNYNNNYNNNYINHNNIDDYIVYNPNYNTLDALNFEFRN